MSKKAAGEDFILSYYQAIVDGTYGAFVSDWYNSEAANDF